MVYASHVIQGELKLDEENYNNDWKNGIRIEFQQLMDYDTFIDKGLRKQS